MRIACEVCREGRVVGLSPRVPASPCTWSACLPRPTEPYRWSASLHTAACVAPYSRRVVHVVRRAGASQTLCRRCEVRVPVRRHPSLAACADERRRHSFTVEQCVAERVARITCTTSRALFQRTGTTGATVSIPPRQLT